jgi:hypothetical protein
VESDQDSFVGSVLGEEYGKNSTIVRAVWVCGCVCMGMMKSMHADPSFGIETGQPIPGGRDEAHHPWFEGDRSVAETSMVEDTDVHTIEHVGGKKDDETDEPVHRRPSKSMRATAYQTWGIWVGKRSVKRAGKRVMIGSYDEGLTLSAKSPVGGDLEEQGSQSTSSLDDQGIGHADDPEERE